MKHHRISRMTRLVSLCVLGMSCIAIHSILAQPNLNLKRIYNDWPTIELYFTVSCDGNPTVFTDKSYFSVHENGAPVSSFELWCPDPTIRGKISAALVFDASGSMVGMGNASAKAAGNAFIDLMDGITDEAAILWFNSTVTTRQGMTTSRTLLHGAVNDIPFTGGTSLWDGIYAGLQEIITNGVNPSKAVVAFTDGADGGSTRTPAELISIANKNHIRIYTVGFGNAGSFTVLQNIASLTGGYFYQVSDSIGAKQVYQEITTRLFMGGFGECLITYLTDCMDGSLRTVDLTLSNFCNGSDTKTKSYRAPRDTTTFTPVEIRLGEDSVRGGGDAILPLRLVTNLDGLVFSQSAVQLLFDTSLLKLKNVATIAGDLWHGYPVSIFPQPDGAVLLTQMKATVQAGAYPRMLASLVFSSRTITEDSLRVPVRMKTWTFNDGCLAVRPMEGSVLLFKSEVNVLCNINPALLTLTWDASSGDYLGSPFDVKMSVVNIGSMPALNSRYRISFDKDAFELVSPAVDSLPGNPVDIPPSGSSEVQWRIRAKRRSSSDTLRVVITGSYDNHYDIDCFSTVRIPAADPELECDVQVTPVGVDTVKNQYDPMPFAVNLSVRNLSGVRTDSILARILVPGDLRVDGPGGYQMDTKHIQPVMLNPSETGTTTWMLWHPPTASGKTYDIDVQVMTSPVNSSHCTAVVHIPPMPRLGLNVTCSVPDSLHYDEALQTYLPNPFTVTVYCQNKGIDTVKDVTGIILPPSGVMVAGQPAVQRFTPADIPEYKGGPLPSLSWNVQYIRKQWTESFLDFRFNVRGLLGSGEPVDTTVTCRVRVPAATPQWCCDLQIPDTLALNAPGTDVVPNPFHVRYRLWNCGTQSDTITAVQLYYPARDSIAVDPSTPAMIQMIRPLLPGDTVTCDWIINVKNRQIVRRPSFSVWAIGKKLGAIYGDPPCSGSIGIAAVMNVDATDPIAAAGGFGLDQNIPNPFSASTIIPYHLGANSFVTIDIFNTLGMRVARLLDSEREPGEYQVRWNGADDHGRMVASGLYLCRMQVQKADGVVFTQTRHVVRAW